MEGSRARKNEVAIRDTEREERTLKKKLENRLKMLGKAGGRGGSVKNPKKMKPEPDDDDVLDDLVTEMGQDKRQPSYSQLEPGGFVTKGADRKTRLDQRQARIVAAAGKPDEGQEEGMEQERF